VESFHKEDVVEKKVIETSGRVLGKVKDILFDTSGTVTLIVEGPDGRESQVPLSRVTGIAEHVVVRSEITSGVDSSASGLNCKFCGAALTTGQRICPACGRAQA